MSQLISIIIPTYNRSSLLGETLETILAQTYKNWECIIVDDRSTDHTKELLEFYCNNDLRIQYYERPKEKLKGANSCRNYGFQKSRGEFINWFDSDDLMFPRTFLEDCISEFNIDPNLDLVISDFELFCDTTKEIFHVQENRINDLLLDYLTGKINFGCPCVLWKKDAVNQYQYDERLTRAQELNFHFEVLSNQNVKYKHLAGTRLQFRRHEESLTSTFQHGNLQSLRSELTVRRKILKYLSGEGLENKTIIFAFNIYLSTFRKLCKVHPIKKVLIELKKLENSVGFNEGYKKWKLKLFLYLMLYKITRREYQLKFHILSLKNLINVPS